ncbi:hypothetical protein CIPAW_09G181800 [Carya illinoinensis]|uniref:Uncharacterized protein n=1 Tax=Carya illinoinensis TaxID=32201 RepID=A0A8T1PP62_CARIL|nr:hypothetical protein CIPAW_09G181800 [Carya illinoinensis]KAG6697131.1 hypothetical protein I3842_09G183200 [Carya illinoinensis]
MLPKQQSKADLTKKQKIVEEKSFGLKNKSKSKNVQKYVQSLKQSVQPKPDPTKSAAKKEEEGKAQDKELDDLFKIAVSQPKVPVVNNFVILILWTRKGEKIDLYSDKSDQETMEDWDQQTLEKIVESKKTEYKQNKPTDIVCKYFLEAVEKKQYGWFWFYPNEGKDCHYRHALPLGYVLKSQMKAQLEEETEKITIEEEIKLRSSVVFMHEKLTTTTPMTQELFMQWKKKKLAERIQAWLHKR